MNAATDEIYQRLRKQLDDALNADKRLANIAEKIKRKQATLADTAEYSEIVANHIAAVLQAAVGDIRSPLGKELVCRELLRDHYAAINDVLGTVQAIVDEQREIHIRPQQAAFPAERVQKVAHALEDPTVSLDIIRRRANAPVANVAKSFHDDYIKENAKFRADAGLKCWIVRTTDGKCCKWCTQVAGRYEYGTEPEDVYRRHDNCGCTTIYENGRQRQDVWSKKTWEAPAEGAGVPKPTILTPAQGRALQAKHKPTVLTKGSRSGIIEAERQRGIVNMHSVEGLHTSAGNRRSPRYELTEYEIENITTEIVAIDANPDDFVFNSRVARGTCFMPSDGKVHIRGNIFPDESSTHPRDRMSVRAVLAHEYYGHRPYREQYIREDNDTSPDAINRIMARQWADEFRASYMAAKNTPNLSDEDRFLLIRDALSRAEDAGVSIKYNDFIRRILYG